MSTKAPIGWTTMEILILAAIFTILAILIPGQCKGQTCSDWTPEPTPLEITLTARDVNGVVLYHRKAFIFFSPIEEYAERVRLVANDRVVIRRELREDGERCDNVYPPTVETGEFIEGYCGPNQPPYRKGSK